MGAQEMFSATMAVPLPPAGQDDFVEEVIAEDDEDEPNFEEVLNSVRRMCGKPPGSEVVIELDASSVLAAQGGTMHPEDSAKNLLKILSKWLEYDGVVFCCQFEAKNHYKRNELGVLVDTHPTDGQERCNKRCMSVILGDITVSPVVRKHPLHMAGKLFAVRQGPAVASPWPAEFVMGSNVGNVVTLQGPRGSVSKRIDAGMTSDFDGVLASDVCIVACHEKDGNPRAKAFDVFNRGLLCAAMGVVDKYDLAFLSALQPEQGDTTGFSRIAADYSEGYLAASLAREEALLEMAKGIGNIAADASIATGDAFGPGDCDVGHVAKAFKEKVEARGGYRMFPADGVPMSVGRSRANHLVRIIATRPDGSTRPAAERERIWRRFRNYEMWLA